MSKKLLLTVYFSAFMLLWTTGMVTSLTAKKCRDDLWRSPEKVSSACTIHRVGFALFQKIGQPERASEAIFYLHDALKMVENGDHSDAQAAFDKSANLALKDRDTIQIADYTIPVTLARLIRYMGQANLTASTKDLWRNSLQKQAPQVFYDLEKNR